jgi:UDPglucose 6-dehydrogenase
MRIVMIGTGYVGLVSGACFSDFGHEVTCIDRDAGKIAQLNSGAIPIFEPGLGALVASNVAAGRLTFASETAGVVRSASAIFLAVGTPSRHGDGYADLTFIHEAAREVASEIEGFAVIVIKSTVPVGTSEEVEAIIRRERPNAQFAVVSNPEFLREGAAIEDFKHPDRVVVGVEDERARAVMREVYRPLFINETPILFTSRRAAELIKYASNAFLATKITFINEMADLCEKCGADVQEIARGMGLDRRVARQFLHAGPGFGGSCFPKDTAALAAIGQHHGAPVKIVETVIAVNDARKRAMADKVVAACGGSLAGKTIAVLGLTFKPNTDDMREAPSLVIIPALLAQGARVRAYDPHGMSEAKKLLPRLDTVSDPYACVEGADAMVILTEWDQFRALDLGRVKAALKSPIVVDLRNIYRPVDMRAKGFSYVSVGRQ